MGKLELDAVDPGPGEGDRLGPPRVANAEPPAIVRRDALETEPPLAVGFALSQHTC